MKRTTSLLEAVLVCSVCLGFALPSRAGLVDGLAFYVPFTDSVDDVQGGQSAHVNGDATRQNSGGIAGGYLQLQNSTTILPEQYIDFPDVPIGTSDFSVSIWVRSTDASAGQAENDVSFFSNKDWDSGGNQGWVLARGASDAVKNKFQWNFATSIGGRADLDPSGDNAIVFDGKWHHIVVTHARASVATFYVDGVNIATVDISSSVNGNINGAGLRLALGNDGTGAYDHGDGSSYNGDLDEAAIWTRTITPDEIAEIYGAGLQGYGLYDTANARAFFKSVVPTANTFNAAGNTPVGATIQAGPSPVDQTSIKMFVDGASVIPVVTVSGADTIIQYQPPQILLAGSEHSARIEASDTGNPVRSITNTWTFTVINYPTLPVSYAKPEASANTPGFLYRTVQAPATMASTVARAVAQIDGTLVDPGTGLPYVNIATPGPNPDGSYNLDTVINFEQQGLSAGTFSGDVPFPGLPAADNDNFATEAIGYLDLAAGYYRFGVNSDDGFVLWVGDPPRSALASTMLGIFDGGRATSESAFDFLAPVTGIYCFRLIYYEAQGGASCEFYSINPVTGERILINDPINPNSIKSYRVLTGVPQPPYVREVSPVPGAGDVRVDTAISAVLVDGATALDQASVQMKVNGVVVAITKDQNGNVTSITNQPVTPLPYKATNTVTLVFGDGTILVTNSWIFVTRAADQKPGITGQWDFDNGDLSATIGLPLEYIGGPSGPALAKTHFGTTTSFGIPDINGVPAKVMHFDGSLNNTLGYVMHHGAVPNGGPTATKVNQWTLIMDVMFPNKAAEPWFSFIQIDSPINNDNDGDLFANFSGGTAGLGISGSYPKNPPINAGQWHRITFAVDAAQTISKYVDGVKTADQTGWSGVGFDGRHAMFPTALLFADEDGESQQIFVNSVQFRNYKLPDAAVLALGGPTANGIPAVTGQWDFDAGDLTATIGTDLLVRSGYDSSLFTTFESATINGDAASVLHFEPDPGNGPVSGYVMTHGGIPNGAGLKVNKYTVIMDIMFPSTSPGFQGYRSLWQTETNDPTTSDGDFFVSSGNGLGISSQYQGSVTPDTWHRIAFTMDLTKRELGKYLDGSNVLSGPVGDAPLGTGPYQYLNPGSGIVDQRWALENTAVLFGDDDGEQGGALINSIQFRPVILTPVEIALLGGPSATGIPLNVPTTPPLSTAVDEFGDLTISWAANYSGFTLESSPSLGSGADWQPVGGVVNNSVSLTPNATGAAFFRLRK